MIMKYHRLAVEYSAGHPASPVNNALKGSKNHLVPPPFCTFVLYLHPGSSATVPAACDNLSRVSETCCRSKSRQQQGIIPAAVKAHSGTAVSGLCFRVRHS